MSFFKKLFLCGCRQSSDSSFPQLPSLCVPKKESQPEELEKSLKNVADSSFKKNAKITDDFSSSALNSSQEIPQTRAIHLNSMKTVRIKSYDWGFVVGLVQSGQGLFRLPKSVGMQVRIGRGNEIQNLLSLRGGSLDSLVVYWSQLGCEFRISEILKSRQKLLLVFQQWQTLCQVIKTVDGELVGSLGNRPLRLISDRLNFNILQTESWFVMEFVDDPLLEKNIREILIKQMKIQLTEEEFQIFMERLTLGEYLGLRKNIQEIGQILYRHLHEKERQLNKKSIEQAKQQISSKIIEIISEHRPTTWNGHAKKKNSEENEEVCNLETKREFKRPPPIQISKMQTDLNIFNYNLDEQTEECGQKQSSSRRENLVSPSYGKRVRYKSMNTDYETYDFFDQEMFQKYA